MTKDELKQKVEELLISDKDFIDQLINKALNNIPDLILAEHENNFVLPKLTLSAIYQDMSRQYKPLYKNRKLDQTIKKIYSLI